MANTITSVLYGTIPPLVSPRSCVFLLFLNDKAVVNGGIFVK